MEINVKYFIESEDMRDYSSSIAETGIHAASITWENAIEYSRENPLMTKAEEFGAMREYLMGFGAWEDSEILGFSETELNALLVQLIAGDVRERNTDRISDGFYYIGD